MSDTMTNGPDARRSQFQRWRETAGFSLAEMSDITGLSTGFLSRLERGQRKATAATKVMIARAFSVRVRDLFEVEELEEVDDGVA